MLGTNNYFNRINESLNKKRFQEDEESFNEELVSTKIDIRKNVDLFAEHDEMFDSLKKFPNKQNKVTEEDLYEENGGTAIMIKVDNKLIIAADTRLNAEYNIYTRFSTKIFKIGDFYLTAVGFYGDAYNIFIRLNYELNQYEQYKKMSLSALAQYLHQVLYSRRFFPLYAYCNLGGYENDEAIIYTFDCVGSYQSTSCRVDGSGTKMIQPLLDSWIDGKNFKNYKGISFKDAVDLIKKAFDSAAESDVKTGDTLEIIVNDNGEEQKEYVELRKD